jgi:hypothetical protein
MPDLAGLLSNPIDQPFLMSQLTGAEKNFPQKMLLYRRHFVRLSDKAARDYTDARTSLLSIVERQKSHTLGILEGRLLMNIVANNFEDCIVTVRRLFNYFERIKADQTRFPMDKLFKKRVEALEGSIRDMRDLIIHMDEDIFKGSITFGDSMTPDLSHAADTIRLGRTELASRIWTGR